MAAQTMLRKDLVDLLNSGEAWAFVGSGPSVEAGLPSWPKLAEELLAAVDPTVADAIRASKRFQTAQATSDWPASMGVIEELAGREALEAGIRASFDAKHATLREMLQHIVDWPFAGYITTNYDDLIEQALAPLVTGWPVIGNSPSELAKLTGGVRGVVWHPHGSLHLPATDGKLVVTDSDYDNCYLGQRANLAAEFQSFLEHHRVVFLGYGFRDAELQRLLKITARACTPTRPAFAFVRASDGVDPADMRRRYNVDVITYPATDRPHAALRELLGTYGAFTSRRSISFGQRRSAAPSYDPETTGLMIFNELVLGARTGRDPAVHQTLLRSRILALLFTGGRVARSTIVSDLDEKVRILAGPNPYSSETAQVLITEAITTLSSDGLVSSASDPDADWIELTDQGQQLVQARAAASRLDEDRFRTALHNRAETQCSGDSEAADRIAQTAEAFLKECMARRALGVAKALGAVREDQRQYQMLALMQALPEFMSQLANQHEASVLVHLLQDVLSQRDAPERAYLGLALQGRFGVHLLGLDPDALTARMADLASTFFLIDSSTVIHYMAIGSSNHEAARLMVRKLKSLGAPVATTYQLVIEVAEHARWAAGKVSATGTATPATLLALLGEDGKRANQFLEGFAREMAAGRSNNFRNYMERVLGAGHTSSDPEFKDAVEREGLPCSKASDFEGYGAAEQAILESMADLASRIEGERQARDTYRHDRQVDAEAEAFGLIRALRSQTIRLKQGEPLRGAFFVSPQRNIDDLAMRPASLLQWLSTLEPAGTDELSILFDGLVSELSDRRVSIVDERELEIAFSPMIHGAKEKLGGELAREQALVQRRWGTETVQDIRDAQGVDAVLALRYLGWGVNRELESERDQAVELLNARSDVARISASEREELQRLRAAEHQRSERRKRKERSKAGRRGQPRK